MMVFELLFVGLFLGSAVTLIGVSIVAVRGRRRAAMRVLKALGVGWGVYLLVVVVAASPQSQQIVPLGEERCFDEMCFSVAGVQTASQVGTVKAGGRFYVVTVRVTSHSRGRTQSEGGLRALVWDSGKSYEVSPGGQRAWEAVNGETKKLTARLAPDESVQSVQVFDLPGQASAAGLVLSHGFTPGYFVIGECPLFHKPAVLRLVP